MSKQDRGEIIMRTNDKIAFRDLLKTYGIEEILREIVLCETDSDIDFVRSELAESQDLNTQQARKIFELQTLNKELEYEIKKLLKGEN
jgi:hypothetical protein